MTILEAEPIDLELTDDESAIAAGLTLRLDNLRGEHEVYRANADRVVLLLAALDARQAIPEHRRRFFLNPDHYPGGRGRSLRQIFEGNGTTGNEIARHPHFLKVMRYFLCGPDVSPRVKRAFAEAVEDAGGEITSDEVIEVSDAARRITREHRLPPHDAAEEFFKLALEHGAHPSWAKHIYDRVRTYRYR